METKEIEKKPIPGEIIAVASELKFVVTDENGKQIVCETEWQAIMLGYQIKLWMKHKNM